MRLIRVGAVVVSCLFTVGVCNAQEGGDSPARHELKRADLSGAPGMEVITSVAEYKKGDVVPKHFHNGIETGYVLEGGMVQFEGKEPTMNATGSPIMNLRGVVHGGYTVVGDHLKIFTVHIVDKGKPLYNWVK
jgi:quercetin dioxygenase-like cupin family protein